MTGWAVVTPRVGAPAYVGSAAPEPVEFHLTPAEREAARRAMRDLQRRRDAVNSADAARQLGVALERLA